MIVEAGNDVCPIEGIVPILTTVWLDDLHQADGIPLPGSTKL
jgi:hypothetical protein